jgi:hypothetical protein
MSCKKPDSSYIVKGRDTIWATAVPEIEEFILIQNYLNKPPVNTRLSDINYRLKQYLCSTYRTKILGTEENHQILDPDQQKWNAENQVHNEKYF